jgi:hypothetical protein
MSLIYLPDGWMRFGVGRRWRCDVPRFFCEVDDPGNVPNYAKRADTISKIRRIKSMYAGRLALGLLDERGTGLDILVANSLAESLGTVPSPLSTAELRTVYSKAIGIDPGVKLDEVVRHVATRAKFLERREPAYVNPVNTPGRVSVGAHHVLISTALTLTRIGKTSPPDVRTSEIADLVCRIPAESLYAAQLAIEYFNKSYPKHLNQPPLLAATYNAGSPRPNPGNAWNLKQYGDHLDRWVAFYNTSRMM